MAFGIHFQNEVFSIESFLQLNRNEIWLNSAQQFISCWQNNSDFSFSSSGSTGEPKVYTFEKWQLEASARTTIDALGLQQANEHILLCLNPHFVGGAMMLARALVLDCPLTLLPPQLNVFENIGLNHPFTFASFVPTQLLDQTFSLEKYNGIRNVLIGGASIPINQEGLLSASTNNSFHTYGMTETLSHVALRKLNTDKGYRALPGNRIRISEEQCICVQTAFLKEELVTNDMAEWIDDSQFAILGRKDIVINSGGIKINPEKLEEQIASIKNSPLKGNFAIAKAPHSVWGEEVVLVCEQELSEMDLQNLLELLRNELPKNILPKRFLVLEQIPRTENGKIKRVKLNEWVDSQ